MKSAKIFGLALALLLSLVGCGSNNSDAPVSDNNGSVITPPEGNISNPAIDVILPVSSTVLTTNSQVVTIDVRAFDSANNPYSEGNISIINSPDVKTGRDVGTFDKYHSAITNGTATFTYTAPANLETNTSNLYFGFYHDSNSSNIKTYTMSIVPETNQTVISSYKLVSSNPDDTTMDLNSTKSISYSIYDDKGNKIDDNSVVSMRVTSGNPGLVTFSDSVGNSSDSIEINGLNTISVNLNSNTKSGLVPLNVEAKFKDANGDTQNLSQVFNIVVFSGPPTAMSVIYNGTSYEQTGLYQENYTILATDKYDNVVNTKPTLSLSMITGYAHDGTDGLRLTSPAHLDSRGTLPNEHPGAMDPVNNIFVADRNFSNVDFSNDFLLTFGNGYAYNASGKWDIDKGANISQLKLVDNFEGNNTSNLGFAVGHNYRQDTCQAGQEFVAQIKIDGNSSKLGDDGIAHIKVDYPYYLGGKTVFIGVEMIGYTASGKITSKFGEVSKVTLRTTGFKDSTISVPANTSNKTYYIPVELKDAPEWYRNGNFTGKIVTSDNITYSDAIFHGQIGTCDNNASNTPGGAYLEILDVNETQGKAGSITLKDIVVANEF